jgi:hypothetical protein
MPRNSDCDMRLDDQDAAATQRKYPVKEPGRVHGASELDIVVLQSNYALMWPQNRRQQGREVKEPGYIPFIANRRHLTSL